MTYRLLYLPAMLLGLLACGSEDGSEGGPRAGGMVTPVVARERVRTLSVPAGADVERTYFVHGPARIDIPAFHGELTLTFQQDSLPSNIERRRGIGDAPPTVPVPGEGSRAVRCRVRLSSGEPEPLVLRVCDREGPLLPTPRKLVGALAGRSLIILLADALHAAHLGCYGAEEDTSPHLDRLAREGTLFERAYSQTSWTVPSVTSLFTGLDQESHGVRALAWALGEEPATLAECFREAGYATAAFVQNGLVARDTGLDRGFDTYVVRVGEKRDQLQTEVLEWLRSPPTQPFFLYVHYLPPHEPYTPPEPYLTRFGPGPGDGIDGTPASIHRLNQQQPEPDHPGLRRMRSLYDGNVAYLDAQIGEVLALVEEHLDPSRLAVLHLADHGEAFGQHRFVGHNVHVFEEMVRIPLILWAPQSGLGKGARHGEPVTLMDILPTLVDLFALRSPDHDLTGQSLAGILEGLSSPYTRVLGLSARYMPSQNGGDGEGLRPLHLAVLAGADKLVTTASGRAGRLLDLSADPHEQAGADGGRRLLREALGEELRSWQQDASSTGFARPFETGEELARELEALGYVRGDE